MEGSAFNPRRSAVSPSGDTWAAGGELWKEKGKNNGMLEE